MGQRLVLKYVIACAIALCLGATMYWCLNKQVLVQPDKEASTLVEAQNNLGGVLEPLEPPQIDNQDKVFLGKQLFMDPRLSKTNSVSCNSCHNLKNGGVDGLQFSVGINQAMGEINSPTVFNAALNFRQFWDGRAENLVEQIEGPIHNPKEMGSTWPEIVTKLKADSNYVQQFSRHFEDGITAKNIVNAIVTFEKTLITIDSPFDQYLRGNKEALTEKQILGYQKFTTLGCVACHQGRNIGGNMYQTFGITGDYFKDRGGSYSSDAGRFNVTKMEVDRHVFRVPSLRNVAITAPYFHDGSAKTLEEAVRKMAKYQLGRALEESDVQALVEFLKSLTGKRPTTLDEREVASEVQAH